MNFLNSVFSKIDSNCISGLTDELKVQYISYLAKIKNGNIVVLTSSLYVAAKFYNMISLYNSNCYFFPMDDFVSSVLTTASPDLMVKRLDTLSHIASEKSNIIVTNLYGFLKYLPSREQISNMDISLKVGDVIERSAFEKKLFDIGYNKTSIVTSTGEYAVRGYIVDIFPYHFDHPVRFEFFGNEIESIKMFDSDSQLSINNINEIIIKPFKEILFDDNNSLYDLLDSPLVIKIDNDLIDKTNFELLRQITDYRLSNEIDDDVKFMFNYDDIKIKEEVLLNSFDNNYSLKLYSQSIESFNSNFDNLEFFINHRKNDMITIFAIDSTNLANVLKKTFKFSNSDVFKPGELYLINSKINKGFIFDKYIVICDNDIEGSSYSNTYYNPIKIGRKIKDFNDLHVGDYIVHRSHGIGIYGGVVNLVKNGFNKDFILLKYDNNDKIYLPVEKIGTIYKYADADSVNVKINSLNSITWAKAKMRAKSRIKDISKDLIKLYSERSKIKCPVFKEFPEEVMFEADFDYTLTRDQITSINDVLRDLSSSKPMDRLICGDVGFGKTEVAFRAIFRTIMNGYQCAYLCPTTILSKQQYESALKRFRNFPINIKLVNRFTTQGEFKKILDDLINGKIDLLFGTHKLFNSEIKFGKLGLLVVDEEQRFGVMQKEKIKELTKNINVLTLSATPIPRTLKMAMSGLRDLSILDTAPAFRYPIQTYVAEENDFLIRETIYKELARNGQVFYLYNNVEHIENELFKLKELVPDARICLAHGKMNKSQLEKVVDDFVNYKYDVLVCTTIIETGIDISNVNTLIVKNAQNFGLSQLYQLRGRVGRSNKIAYAYLLYKRDKILSEIAIKRLSAIKEFTELGSGYKIAMRDLAIRGAGDLLGSQQAGFIDSVGIELFTKMMEEAISEINGVEITEEDNLKTLLDVNTHIDEEYVSDESVRIEIHKLINSVCDFESLKLIKKEIEDRFGTVSEDLVVYMYEEWFEKLALKLEINKVIQNSNFIEFNLPKKYSDKVDGEKLFLICYNISHNFSLKYVNSEIIIKLNLRSLEKNYIYYLVQLLEEIVRQIV